MNETEKIELRIRIAKAKGYPVSWWSIHSWNDVPADCKEIDGVARPCTMGAEVLLPDDKGDMPMLEMQVDGVWVGVPDWPSEWGYAGALIAEMPRFQLNYYNHTIKSPAAPVWKGRYEMTNTHEYYGVTGPEVIASAYAVWKEAQL